MLAVAHWEDRSGDRPVKYKPGDEVPDDHPKREWLLRSKIVKLDEDTADDVKPEKVEPVDDTPDEDTADEVEEPATDPKKPKPTDSVDAHRAYLKARKIDTKGLTRPQMIKIIAGLED